jgi:hypothetical protein
MVRPYFQSLETNDSIYRDSCFRAGRSVNDFQQYPSFYLTLPEHLVQETIKHSIVNKYFAGFKG